MKKVIIILCSLFLIGCQTNVSSEDHLVEPIQYEQYKGAFFNFEYPRTWTFVDLGFGENQLTFHDNQGRTLLEIVTTNLYSEFDFDTTIDDMKKAVMDSLTIQPELITIHGIDFNKLSVDNNTSYFIFHSDMLIEFRINNASEEELLTLLESFKLESTQSIAEDIKKWQTVSLNGFNIHYPLNSPITMNKEYWLNKRQEAVNEFCEAFNLSLEEPIEIYMFNSYDHGENYGFSLGFAKPHRQVVFAHFEQSPGHELTHCMAYQLNNAAINSPLIKEGIATLFDYSGRDFDKLSKLSMRNEKKDILGERFRTHDDAYILGASFVNYLITEKGTDTFVNFYGETALTEAEAFEKYYNQTGESLVNAWYERIMN